MINIANNAIGTLKILVLLKLLLASFDVVAQQPNEDKLEQVAEYTSTINASKGTQIVNVEATLFIVTNNLAADKKLIAEILILREPKTGLTWWEYQEKSDVKVNADSIANLLRNNKIYLSDDVIGSVILSYKNLLPRESSEKYPSMSEAKSQVLKAFVTNISKDNGYYSPQEIDISEYIPWEFFHGDRDSQFFAKLESVRTEGKMTVFSLSGWNNTKLDVEINEQHQVTKLTSYPEHKAKN